MQRLFREVMAKKKKNMYMYIYIYIYTTRLLVTFLSKKYEDICLSSSQSGVLGKDLNDLRVAS